MNTEGSRLNVASINTRQSYPWLSTVFGAALVLYLLAIDIPELQSLIAIPYINQTEDIQRVLAVLLLLFIAFDVQRFMRGRKRIKKNTEILKQELESIWLSKRKLQQKAHTYSGHADKLKLFISDKLLEYIEYDEKFLHFKNIASEVRHNGVISYDIVKTALQKALENEREKRGSENDESALVYSQALDAMRYLWDLLDLSTADNIALHIGNHLIECEEHYYQILLNKEQGEALYQPVPYRPCFSATMAALNTVKPLLESPEGGVKFEAQASGAEYYKDRQFRITLATKKALLGNENHVRLILENLLKNAQHFSSKTPYKQKSDRISLRVFQTEGAVEYSIYNRGPLVSEDDREKLFQLGYSTRRVKENHGKGLGLYFVNEIVRAYEGVIEVKNISNETDVYSIRIGLKNGEVITKVIKTDIETGRPLVGESQTDELKKIIQWEFDSPIESVEISSSANSETQVFDKFEHKKATTALDRSHPDFPFWTICIQPKRSGHKAHSVQFTPLDINGVIFNVKLPSAESHIDGDEAIFSIDFEQEVDKLNEYFRKNIQINE